MRISDWRSDVCSSDLGGSGNAVLARTCFRDDPGLAHASGQQDLADAIIDLVCAGVIQFFTLEINLCAAQFLGQSLGKIKGIGSADILAQQKLEFLLEFWILLGGAIFAFQLKDERSEEGR